MTATNMCKNFVVKWYNPPKNNMENDANDDEVHSDDENDGD